jgi:hypothetical protein
MGRPRCIDNYEDAQWSFYRFEPSLAGNVIFVALFGLSSLLHVLQMYKTRTWYLTALIIGALGELRQETQARQESEAAQN